ncbi:MAG: hypothetical protein JXO44_06170 [Clostridia bacterium]|nr:hypothetical protein [Clostridia bacterium]
MGKMLKGFIGLILMMTMLFSLNVTGFAEAEDDYTILIYMNGSDLESAYDEFEQAFFGSATADLEEMIAGYDNNQNINVIVETGGTAKWANDFVDGKKTQRFELVGGKFLEVGSLPNQNMGYKKTLSDFIIWGTRNYPAKKTALILWNHGAGPVVGYGYDENFDGDSLQLNELHEALKTAYNTTGVKFEMLGFDACLMASLEVADVIQDYANVLVGSQELEPGHGWQYTELIKAIIGNPSIDGASLGQIIADTYYQHAVDNQTEDDITLAVIDLSKIENVVLAFEDLIKEANSKITEDTFFYEFSKSALSAKSFGGNTEAQGYTDLIDLKDFSEYLSSYQAEKAAKLAQTIDEAVVYRIDGDFVYSSCGLSIYFPYRDKDYYEENMLLYSKNNFSEVYMTFLKTFRNRLEKLVGDGTIDYTFIEATDESPYYELVFSEDEMNKVYYIYIDLYEESTNPEEDGYLYRFLGTDSLVTYDEESGGYLDNFQFLWTIFGGEPLMTYVVSDYDTFIEYESPVLYNGELMNLLFAWVSDYETEVQQVEENGVMVEQTVNVGEPIGGHYEIYGLRRGIDEETGMPDKNLYQLEAGSILTPVYEAITVDGRDVIIEGTSVTVTDEVQLIFDELKGSSFQLAFRFIDFSYEAHTTDFYPFQKAE